MWTISFGSLSGSGLLQGNSSGVHTLSVGALNTDSTFSGLIKDTSGTVALSKVGSGTLTLTGVNTYTGGTAVNAGSLVISTVSSANGTYTVANNATLAVTNVSSGSALVSNLTVSAGSTLEFQNISSTTVPPIASSNVTVSGSCMVKINGTNSLVTGNSYPLLSYAGTLSGTFMNLQLQMPYGWRGTLASVGKQIVLTNVAVVATTPPQVTTVPGSSQLQLAWPATHTGWRLQVQTNWLNSGLGTNWTDIPATFTNQIAVPISTVNGSVFYRLVYP